MCDRQVSQQANVEVGAALYYPLTMMFSVVVTQRCGAG